MLPGVDWHTRYTQQARWTHDLRQYLYQRVGLNNARRVLDLGCGTGVLLEELYSQTMPSACAPFVAGLDLARTSLLMAIRNAPGAFLTQGDAHTLPYSAYTFDITLCHFLLLWVEKPLWVVQEMKRVTRPGGFVLALAEPDYGGRIDYPEALHILGEWQSESLRQQGADPTIGRKLAGIFHQAGLQDVETGVLGGQWSGLPSDEDWEQEWDVLESDLKTSEACDAREIADLRALDRAAWQRGERVLFVPTFYARGRVLSTQNTRL